MRALILSFAVVMAWSVESVYSRVVMNTWEIDPLVYMCLSLFLAALTMLIAAGPGRLGVDTIRQPHTWAFSVFDVMVLLFFILSVQYVTATQSNLLNRNSIVLTLLATWFVFGRAPKLYDYIGLVPVIAGITVIALNLDPQVQVLTLLFCFLLGMAQAARTLIAESHPSSNEARTIRERCRCTGYVLYVTSVILLLILAGQAWLKTQIPLEQIQQIPILTVLPDVADFYIKETVLVSLFFGIFILSLMTYLYLWASVVAKSELLMLMIAFLPVTTFFVEWIADLFDLTDLSTLSQTDAIGGALILAGALFMIFMRQMQEFSTAKALKKNK